MALYVMSCWMHSNASRLLDSLMQRITFEDHPAYPAFHTLKPKPWLVLPEARLRHRVCLRLCRKHFCEEEVS
jgi:hypothetical protein